MIEVRGLLKEGSEISALHTDSAERALHFSTVMNDNGHYAGVFVVVGNSRMTHQEFATRAGAIHDQDLYRQ